jgi:hypothetical protein
VNEPLPLSLLTDRFVPVVKKATEKLPEKRFQSCEEFMKELSVNPVEEAVVSNEEENISSKSEKELLRSNQKRAKVAVVFILTAFVLNAISYIYGDVAEYDEVSYGDLLILFDLFAVLIIVVSTITFIRWFRRAYYNLHLLTECKYTDGWAAGAWFVPILNLFRPYQIMKELYVKTIDYLKQKGVSFKLSTSSLPLWWILWLVSNVFLYYYLFYESYMLSIYSSTDPAVLDVHYFSDVIDGVSFAIDVMLTVITVKVIKDYSKVEPLLSK